MEALDDTIKKVTLADGIERYFLDSEEKIIEFITKRYDENKEKPEPTIKIDLSFCIINLDNGNEFFTPNILCKALPEICSKDDRKFIINGSIKFDHSIIYSLWFNCCSFQDYVSFEGTKFYSVVNFNGSIFEEKVYFSQISFYEKSKIVDYTHSPLISGISK